MCPVPDPPTSADDGAPGADFVPDPILLASLELADADGPDQEAVRVEMLNLARVEVDSLLRTCEPGHFTGSALIVDSAGERLLVLFHAKAQRWFQPGGHADGDPDLAAVALREAEEETGIVGLTVVGPAIDLDIHWLRPVGGAPPHRHLDVRYLLRAPTDAVIQGNHESEALRWVTFDELLTLDPDQGLVRAATRALSLASKHG